MKALEESLQMTHCKLVMEVLHKLAQNDLYHFAEVVLRAVHYSTRLSDEHALAIIWEFRTHFTLETVDIIYDWSEDKSSCRVTFIVAILCGGLPVIKAQMERYWTGSAGHCIPTDDYKHEGDWDMLAQVANIFGHDLDMISRTPWAHTASK
jgi:hypothetical protein